MSSNSEKAPLLKQIKEAELDKVFIGLGAGIDPDGLASQMAMVRIIKDINPEAQVECFYRGDWDRAQNRTMREVLGCSPRPYEDAGHEYTCAFMVDGNNSVMPDGLTADFIIDHHEGNTNGALRGSDIRLIGSCSAIMWEYIMAQNSDLLEGEDGMLLATALAIGIETDTEGKTAAKTSPLDWEAEAYCGMRADISAYAAIKNYTKPIYQKDIETQAWQDKIIEGTVLVTPIGLLTPTRKGVISACAEEFCGQGPVKTTLAAADIDGDIHLSARTLNSSMNMNEFIKTLTPYGGGKPGAGAGVVKLPTVFKGLPKPLREEVFNVLFKALAHKTFEFCGDGVRQSD